MEAMTETLASLAWEAPLQLLHKQFYDTAHDRCLLWVNPAQGDPFSSHAIVQKRKIVVPIAHPRFDQRFAPYLIELALDEYADAELTLFELRHAPQVFIDSEGQSVKGESLLYALSDPVRFEIVRYLAGVTEASCWRAV